MTDPEKVADLVAGAEHMTDDQWLGLMALVNDDRSWDVTFPSAPGEAVVVVDPEGFKRSTITADGETTTEEGVF